jgi:hypothetical protein
LIDQFLLSKCNMQIIVYRFFGDFEISKLK